VASSPAVIIEIGFSRLRIDSSPDGPLPNLTYYVMCGIILSRITLRVWPPVAWVITSVSRALGL
jgi:hypothetical protein